MNKLTITIITILIILIILLLGSGIYIGNNELQKQRLKYYQSGIRDGVSQAVDAIVEQAITCNPVTLTYENNTYQLKEVRCTS